MFEIGKTFSFLILTLIGIAGDDSFFFPEKYSFNHIIQTTLPVTGAWKDNVSQKRDDCTVGSTPFVYPGRCPGLLQCRPFRALFFMTQRMVFNSYARILVKLFLLFFKGNPEIQTIGEKKGCLVRQP